jgi:valyl-tRNA synthetase
MRLLHPIEPFITEEVWLTLPHDGQTIMTATWPDTAEIPVDRGAAATFEELRRAVERLRNLRAEIGLQPRDVLELRVPASVPESLASLVATYTTGKAQAVQGGDGSASDGLGAIAGVAPKGVLAERYRKEAVRLRGEVERGQSKLADERFVANAKPLVVAKEREKLENYRSELTRIEAALEEMGVGI